MKAYGKNIKILGTNTEYPLQCPWGVFKKAHNFASEPT